MWRYEIYFDRMCGGDAVDMLGLFRGQQWNQ